MESVLWCYIYLGFNVKFKPYNLNPWVAGVLSFLPVWAELNCSFGMKERLLNFSVCQILYQVDNLQQI
jgi:hypothetical protein